VVVGGGLAGLAAAEAIQKLDRGFKARGMLHVARLAAHDGLVGHVAVERLVVNHEEDGFGEIEVLSASVHLSTCNSVELCQITQSSTAKGCGSEHKRNVCGLVAAIFAS
jgi:hypothetical protein